MKREDLLYKLNLKEREPTIALRKEMKRNTRDIFNVFQEEDRDAEQLNEYGLTQWEVRDALEKMLFFQDRVPESNFLYAWDKHDKEGKENGAVKFSKVVNAKLYNQEINKPEERIMQDDEMDTIISQISRKKKTHIELWPESGEKFVKYANEWDPWYDNLKGKKYIGVDVSGVYVDLANKNVEKIGMRSESVPWDWFKHSIFDNETDQMYHFYGGSIDNLPVWYKHDATNPAKNKTIMNLFKRMRSNNPFSRVPVVVTYFEAPDEQDPKYEDNVDKLKAAYGAKESPYYDPETHLAISDFILSGLNALGIPRSHLKLAVDYVLSTRHDPAKIRVGATFTKRTEIQIGKSKVVKEAGQCIWAIESQRFKKDEFQQIAKEADFETIHQKSDNGVAVAVMESKIGLNDKFKNLRNLGYAALIATTLLAGGLITKHVVHEKNIKKELKKQNQEQLRLKKLFSSSDEWFSFPEELTPAKKEIFVHNTITGIIEDIKIHYGLGDIDQSDLYNLIHDEIMDGETINVFFTEETRALNMAKFADEFVQSHPSYFTGEGINITPYSHFKEHERQCKNTINLELTPEEQKMKFDFRIAAKFGERDAISWWINIGTYQWLDGTIYDVWTHSAQTMYSSTGIQDPQWRDNYIFAAPYSEYSEDMCMYFYTLDASKVVAYGYYEQSRPVVRQILSTFSTTFLDKEYNPYENNQQALPKDDWRELIIKDLVNTGKIDLVESDNHLAIGQYIVSFVGTYKEQLQKRGVSVIPHDTLSHYEDALQNTIALDNTKSSTKIACVTEEDRKTYDFKYLGTYTTRDGKVYKVGSVILDDKRYIVAQDVNEENVTVSDDEQIFPNEFYLFEGATISKDYFTIKNIFK